MRRETFELVAETRSEAAAPAMAAPLAMEAAAATSTAPAAPLAAPAAPVTPPTLPPAAPSTLDEFLALYVPNPIRQAAVREAADSLTDLRCDEADLWGALALDTWPKIPQKKLLTGWRRLNET